MKSELRYYAYRSPGQFKSGVEAFCPKHDMHRLAPGKTRYNAAEDMYIRRLRGKSTRHSASCDVCAGRIKIIRSGRKTRE